MPSEAEWRRLHGEYGFDRLFELIACVDTGTREANDVKALANAVSASRLTLELHNRFVDVVRCHTFMRFYHRQGIPDSRSHISPGRRGQSIEYFPDFEEKHFALKSWFDFYSESFYQKLFAALDTLGHLLNVQQGLGMSATDITFARVVNRIKQREPSLFAKLTVLLSSPAYVRAKAHRNNITHTESPASTGMTATWYDTPTAHLCTFGLKPYVTATQMLNDAVAAIDACTQALQLVSSDKA